MERDTVVVVDVAKELTQYRVRLDARGGAGAGQGVERRPGSLGSLQVLHRDRRLEILADGIEQRRFSGLRPRNRCDEEQHDGQTCHLIKMLAIERYSDVERVMMWTRRSMSVGYHVSAFVTRGVVIDTGFPSMAGELAAWLRATRPRGVFLTHAHEDHAGNVDVVARLGIPIKMPPATLAELQAAPRPGLYRLFVWGHPRRIAKDLHTDHFEEPDLSMVPTPGHSADHHVVWDAERLNVFGGDLFLGVRVRMVAPWEDPRAHAASLRRIIALRPKRLFDAHRGLIMDPTGILTAKADWIEGTVAAIERRLADGWNYGAIAREVLGPERSLSYVSGGEYSHRNFVATVASPRDRAPSQTRPT